MVHRRARGKGVGKRLMETIEAAARESDLTLLTLDTKRGDTAERLYAGLGWSRAGIIPRFALNPDGTMHDTVIFYKEL
jgi:GNAT superfamily N-acetyltransferase